MDEEEDEQGSILLEEEIDEHYRPTNQGILNREIRNQRVCQLLRYGATWRQWFTLHSKGRFDGSPPGIMVLLVNQLGNPTKTEMEKFYTTI